MKLTSFTHICREIKDVPIYALYPESFCMKNLATRKVFAFSDSECLSLQMVVGRPRLCKQEESLLQDLVTRSGHLRLLRIHTVSSKVAADDEDAFDDDDDGQGEVS